MMHFLLEFQAVSLPVKSNMYTDILSVNY